MPKTLLLKKCVCIWRMMRLQQHPPRHQQAVEDKIELPSCGRNDYFDNEVEKMYREYPRGKPAAYSTPAVRMSDQGDEMKALSKTLMKIVGISALIPTLTGLPSHQVSGKAYETVNKLLGSMKTTRPMSIWTMRRKTRRDNRCCDVIANERASDRRVTPRAALRAAVTWMSMNCHHSGTMESYTERAVQAISWDR
jgi:hypothetical protein